METNISSLYESQRNFFSTGTTRDVDFRIESLKKLKLGINKHYDDLINAVKKDLGKAEFETFATELMGAFDEINLAIKKLHRWAKPKKVRTPLTFFKASSHCYA